jgi:hypothetical protein
MLRGARLCSIVVVVLTGMLAMPVANAAPQVVRIADLAGLFATASTTDRTIQMHPRQASHQSWLMDSASARGTQVVNTNTRLCMGLGPGWPADGTLVVQVICGGGAVEFWRVEAGSSAGTVRIVNARTLQCLTTTSLSPRQLRVFRCANTRAQLFTLVRG